MTILKKSFYLQPVLTVARDLLGAKLVRDLDGERISGIICETEAYDSSHDLACHARNGKTQRNAVMFGEAGLAYVYFTYGMHWCMNAVTGPEGYAAAVLLRAIFPLEGKQIIQTHRGKAAPKNWTNGPAKLTQALTIRGSENGLDLTDPTSGLWIESKLNIPDSLVQRGPRIGIPNVPEPWRSKPWRFWVKENDLADLLNRQTL